MKAFRLNNFLHELIKPEFRKQFLADPGAAVRAARAHRRRARPDAPPRLARDDPLRRDLLPAREARRGRSARRTCTSTRPCAASRWRISRRPAMRRCCTRWPATTTGKTVLGQACRALTPAGSNGGIEEMKCTIQIADAIVRRPDVHWDRPLPQSRQPMPQERCAQITGRTRAPGLLRPRRSRRARDAALAESRPPRPLRRLQWLHRRRLCRLPACSGDPSTAPVAGFGGDGGRCGRRAGTR